MAEDVAERIIKGERRKQGKIELPDVKITKDQQKTLTDYNKHLIAQGRPPSSRISYLRGILRFVPFLQGKGFEDVTREEFGDFMYSLHDKKPATIKNAYATLFGLYKWLGGLNEDEDEDRYIRLLRKERYKPPAGDRHVIKAEDLPSTEEIEKIIKFASSPRDKAAIAMSWDVGSRPHELLNLNVGDVKFDEYGAVVTIGEKGKTGARTLRLILSLPYLKELIESHPLREDKNAPLFCRTDYKDFGGRLKPPWLRQTIQRVAKIAGVDKRIYTYLFRHASITREAGNGLGDQELKTLYGWTPDSRMLQVYSHLTSEDVNKKRLERAGILKTKEKVHELNFRKCPRCGAENPPTSDYCNKCSSPLDEKRYRELLSKDDEIAQLREELEGMKTTRSKIADVDDKFLKIFEDPDVKHLILKKMKEMMMEK